MDKIEEINRNLDKIGERNFKKKDQRKNWRKKSAEFFLNKEKEKSHENERRIVPKGIVPEPPGTDSIGVYR